MLKAIVFVCGAALMGLEIVAARVLAPELGNSIYVWGSVITIVMVALSVGYWAGGQIADHHLAIWALGPIIAGAGVLTIIVPLMAQGALLWAAGLGFQTGALVGSTILFFLPSLLLAMVSPLGVRLATLRGIEHVGRSAGGLYAVSTGGSIVGTLATSFWLIPLLSLEPLIVVIGFLLCGAALLSLALPRALGLLDDDAVRPRKGAGKKGSPAPAAARQPALVAAVATAVLVAVAGVIGVRVLVGAAHPAPVNRFGENVIYQKDTEYHRIYVTRAGTAMGLRFDKSLQSLIDMRDGYTSFGYPQHMDTAIALNPAAKHVLVLGLGAGTIAKRWLRDYPDATIDAVEIDSQVIDVAHRYFGLPDDPRLHVFNEDGRRFVQVSRDKYDVVLVDAYFSDSIPFHLTTREFFEELKGHLSPGGVLAYNVEGSVQGDASKLFRSMYKTVATVWKTTLVFPIDISADTSAERLTTDRNILVVATDVPETSAQVRAAMAGRAGGRVRVADFPRFANDLYESRIDTGDVPLLTDSHAPVDLLIKVQ